MKIMNNNTNKKILVVEDDPIINKTYADELRDQKFNVFTAINGKNGLEMALREKPDIILLDIIMPVMDGLTMMDKLREEGVYGKKVPIILLTNLSADEEKIMQAITKDEPAYYLVKSNWNLSDVVDKIRERLSLH
jgi:DNA-binding response OmpR family regulator